MAIFNEKNQTFRTFDLLALIAMVGTVGSISGAVLAQTFHDSRPVRAELNASAIARQIVARQKQILNAPRTDRAPASAGSAPFVDGLVGKDPWGRQFHYRVRGLDGTPAKARVYVWSDGPDGQSNFHEEKQAFGGDDIGYSEEFSLEHEVPDPAAGSSFRPAAPKN